jgi:SNF2 family DNA or RNA helicase
MTIKLWDFQSEDLTKLENEPEVLMVWDMGTGKTLGGSERDRRLRAKQDAGDTAKTLILAKKDTHDHWRDWLGQVYDDPVVHVFSDDRDLALKHLQRDRPGHYLLNWELLRRGNLRMWAARELYPVLSRTNYPFFHIIADEVHRAQDKDAQQSRVLKKIKTQFKTGMTGTPIPNVPPNLWSVLNWLKPREWSSYWRFFDRYCEWEPAYNGSQVYKKYSGPQNTEELWEKIGPYTVIRRKADVLPDLPDRYYTTIRVDLGQIQRRAYDSMRRNMVAWIGSHEQTPLVATATVAKLQRLQQFAVAHATVTENDVVELSEPSAKLDAVMELLAEAPEEQFVIFSQFKGSIRLLQRRLDDAGISVSVFTGDVSTDARRRSLDSFRTGASRVFAATIGAGGEGIDGLQRASTVIFIDRSWSPAANDQSESRLHRAGQLSSVHVIDIVARDTIDQLKFRRLKEKQEWVTDFYTAAGKAGIITNNDLQNEAIMDALAIFAGG